jgi:predicted flap endonuclease-1-like 5' DNA nuclease
MFTQSILLADCWLCGMGILLPLLLSIIPFLLGWWFQSFATRKWRLRTEALEKEVRDLKGTITSLEKDLEDCSYARNRLDGEVAMLKGRSREMEGQIESLGSQLKSTEAVLESTKTESANLAKELEVVKSNPSAGISGAEMKTSLSDSTDDVVDSINKVDEAAADIVDTDTSTDLSSAIPAVGLGAAGLTSDDSSSGELSEDQLAAGKAVFGFKIKQDDLKIIEGVGPKIEGLLKDGGLKTWVSVGDAKVDTIKKILEDAGPRYRLADPTTWPQQASYAASGEWKALKEYQDKLDGGRLA